MEEIKGKTKTIKDGTVYVYLPSFGKRYLRRYKDDCDDPERRLLSVEEMSRLVNSITIF